eukprot:jgi/Mesvir1/21376/Mv20860-RA.1
MDQSLKGHLSCAVLCPGDKDYEAQRRKQFNLEVPDKFPRWIVLAASTEDVVKTVQWAREHRGEHGGVSCRSGGHSWCGSYLVDRCILLDVSQLRDCSVEAATMVARIGPGVYGRELMALIEPLGLSFPVGHCASVPLSGFLLGGGMGFNSEEWGLACYSVRSLDVVTADGELIHVDDRSQHTEYAWAARGGGGSMPAIAVGFTLQLYRARVLVERAFWFPIDAAAKVAVWLGRMKELGTLPPSIEAVLWMGNAPPDMASATGHAKVLLLHALAHGRTLEDGTAHLATLAAQLPCQPLQPAAEPQQRTISSMLEGAAGLYPADYLADAAYLHEPVFEGTVDLLSRELAASECPGMSHALVIVRGRSDPKPLELPPLLDTSTGGGSPSAPGRASLASVVARELAGGSDEARCAPPADGIVSHVPRFQVNLYAIFRNEGERDAARSWFEKMRGLVATPSTCAGFFAAEADLRRPGVAQQCFATKDHWNKLVALRESVDPHKVICGLPEKSGCDQ